MLAEIWKLVMMGDTIIKRGTGNGCFDMFIYKLEMDFSTYIHCQIAKNMAELHVMLDERTFM